MKIINLFLAIIISFYNISQSYVVPFANKGLWGFINHDGSILVEPKYSDTRTFKENYAAVKTNNKWGLINIQGKEVITPKYLKFKSGSLINQMTDIFIQ